MDISHGLGLFLIGCTVTIVGFFTAFLVVNYNLKVNKKREPNALDDVLKGMPGWKGDDCQ